jgi:hypothetical protein
MGLAGFASYALGVARQVMCVINAPGAALADADFGGSSRLTELVAMLLVLVHLVVCDSLCGQAAYLRWGSKVQR